MMRVHRKKGGFTFARIERKTPVLRPVHQSIQSILCCLVSDRDSGRGGPDGHIISIKRTADRRRKRERQVINKEREKDRTKDGSLGDTTADSKRSTPVTINRNTGTAIREEGLSPPHKAGRKARQKKFIEQSRVPDRVESFRKVDRSKNCPRAWFGFVEPIPNGLRKKENLIDSRSARAETGLAGRKNGVGLQKIEKTG